jgi:hypothetical protein
MSDTIREPARDVRVIADVDVCVLGGSCTGVFAAVRAARLGAKVAIVERQNAFGGVATSGLVNVWHSLADTEYKQRIIAGLTDEMIERLRERDGVIQRPNNPSSAYSLNTEELKIELDQLVLSHGIEVFLHTSYCSPSVSDGRIQAVFVENKDGRGAIRARVFIDATGDGDLAAHVGVPFGVAAHLQPPTTCAKVQSFAGKGFRELYRAHREEFGLAEDSGWQGQIPGQPTLTMVAESHVFGVDCSQAAQLTAAEIEGRRQMRGMMDIVRKYGDSKDLALVALASYIGIRETRRFHTDYTLTEDDVLWGKRFPDAIANGSYRVDVHHPTGGGFLFKYLDGSQLDIRDGGQHVRGRWRDEIDEDPTFYQIPYRTMISQACPNLLLAGRMIGTDRGAFGATRVMVNLNQVGEAAGVAAKLALAENGAVHRVDPPVLRKTLADGGSIIF